MKKQVTILHLIIGMILSCATSVFIVKDPFYMFTPKHTINKQKKHKHEIFDSSPTNPRRPYYREIK